MPKLATVSSITNLSNGTRGRKPAEWNRDEYLIPVGQALDITEDLASACKVDTDTVILALTDRSILTEEQGKKWNTALATARLRAAESNGMPRTESGGYSTAGVVLASVDSEDENGEAYTFAGLHIPNRVEAVEVDSEES